MQREAIDTITGVLRDRALSSRAGLAESRADGLVGSLNGAVRPGRTHARCLVRGAGSKTVSPCLHSIPSTRIEGGKSAALVVTRLSKRRKGRDFCVECVALPVTLAFMTSGLKGLLIAVTCVGSLACAGGQQTVKEEPVPPAEQRAPAVGAAPVCVDENDEPVECEGDSDCCPNFACARAPELNPRKKYCIYTGE